MNLSIATASCFAVRYVEYKIVVEVKVIMETKSIILELQHIQKNWLLYQTGIPWNRYKIPEESVPAEYHPDRISQIPLHLLPCNTL